jgi:hypothetical protein
MFKRGRISDRSHQSEATISAQHMGSFKAEGSAGMLFLQSLCPGHRLARESLIVVAKVLSIISGIHFPRDYTRRKDLIVKWFTDHIHELEPIGRLLTLEPEGSQVDDSPVTPHDIPHLPSAASLNLRPC